MPNSRVSNSVKNLIVSFSGHFCKMLVQFIGRSVFIQILGREYLGLSGLFSNILTMLSLAELGFGSAITFSLYSPLAKGDTNTVKSLMELFRKVYIVVGCIVGIVGIALTPFLQYFVKEMPDIQGIRWIYIMYVLNSSFSYFYTYKRTIILADQKQYIVSWYTYGCSVAMNLLQIIVLVTTKNYFLYLGVMLLFTCIENILITHKANKLYPYIRTGEKVLLPSKEKKVIVTNIKAMLYIKTGHVIVTGTDNLLMAKLVNLVAVGMYSNYLMITSAITTVTNMVYNSISASIGNAGATESDESNLQIFNRINFFSQWLFGFCTICLLCLLTPFISVWIGNENCFTFIVEFAICLNFFVTGLRQPITVTKTAMGLFYQDRYRALGEAAVNLVVSIILGIRFGVSGILIGTVISALTVGLTIEPRVLYRYGFHISAMGYFKQYGIFVLITIINCFITYVLCALIPFDGIFGLICKMLVCIVIPNVIYIFCFKNKEEFRYFVSLLRKIVVRKNNF